ncbi:MAG: zinc-binding alcohol dehydrogenase, partial [Gammaproteobacteria bacterium]|nr:zinc-binding alcohol dehydrogenase [Gammaproteobacteria bacterium]
MKAVLQNVKTGLITLGDIPQPVARPGNILVRNICSLVSAGTEKSVMEFSKANYLKKAMQRPDLFRKVLNRAKNEGLWQTYQVVSNLIDQPIQLGYSSAGVVLEVGAEVTDIRVGQHVACAGLFVATHSEVVSVPRNLAAPIPDGVSFEDASFVTLGAIALQGVRLADLALGEHVVIYGLGLVGMVAAQLALAAGCNVIGVDIDASKVADATDLGCTGVVVAPGFEEIILEQTGGYGADKVVLCAATKSNEPIEKVPEFTRQKGVLVVVGDVPMNIPRRAYYDKEIDIRISRSYGPGRYDMGYEEGGLDYPYAYVRWT